MAVNRVAATLLVALVTNWAIAAESTPGSTVTLSGVAPAAVSNPQFRIRPADDAWLAAATLRLGEHLVSFDRDFRKLIGRSQFTLLEPVDG